MIFQLLVDWTRGKNLIISSAASTVNELRGPYDVANVSTLLGLSMERAKEAISKNCRALMAKSLRKKQWFKEAIKIERISPGEQLNSKGQWLVDLHNWDDISSGEGDLVLDDIKKLFSASTRAPKTSKAIDFISIAKGMLPNNMQLKNLVSGSGAEMQTTTDNTAELLSTAKESRGSDVSDEISKHSSGPSEDATLTFMPSKLQTVGSEDHLDCLPNEKLAALPDDMEMESTKDLSKVAKGLGWSDVVPVVVGTTSLDSSSQECITNPETVPGLRHKTVLLAATVEDIETSTTFDSESKVLPSKDSIAITEGNLMSPIDVIEDSTDMQIDLFGEDYERPKCVDLGPPDVPTNEVLAGTDRWEQTDFVSVACDAPLPSDYADRVPREESGNAIPLLGDAMQLVAPCGGTQGDSVQVADDQPPEEVLVEMGKQKDECSIDTNLAEEGIVEMEEQKEEHSIDINLPTLDKFKTANHSKVLTLEQSTLHSYSSSADSLD
ncbi:uncharacterized protein LOC122085670 isoform X2 [Macadamia integrifolia]|uniref:uncharacterized protein LOC122085670 isoform X2 n=1 Tax=Macadamia integrifolia TaxID=60698 RepID=UPI001C4FABC9|nr:uncharacterized protein LOC122085670 isoform X2 [Macadamia integrifolia]